MDFEKYSKEKFASLGLNTPDARRLADELRSEVHKVIQSEVSPAFLDVIEQLNAQGHNLKIPDDPHAGDLSFRDEPIKDQCCLRLGCDVVINAGYAHDIELTQKDRDSISKKLLRTWETYIDAVHRFITLNISVIVGVAAVVSLLSQLRGAGNTAAALASKRPLFWGLVLLVVCLILLVVVRIWAQQFMDYEVLQPPEAIKRYFEGRIHFSYSYRLSERSYHWQYITVRIITVLAPLSFLAGLILSLLFLYQNL